MEELKCDQCDRVLEGYSKRHVEYLMLQHKLTHRKEDKKDE
tara:strand:+ start:72 stop:194 length:123 start_codon:yes stop_codon:yes gene_type:complete